MPDPTEKKPKIPSFNEVMGEQAKPPIPSFDEVMGTTEKKNGTPPSATVTTEPTNGLPAPTSPSSLVDENFDFSNPLRDVATGQVPVESLAFNPEKFQQDFKQGIATQRPKQDNVPIQAGAQEEVQLENFADIEDNRAKSVIAKPVIEKAMNRQIVQPLGEGFSLTEEIKKDLPNEDIADVLGNRASLSAYYKQKNDVISNQIKFFESSELRGSHEASGELPALRKKQKELADQVYHYNAIHAGLEGGGDATKTGVILGISMNDKQSQQQDRFMKKGIAVNPAQAMQSERMGLNALDATLDVQYADDQQNPAYVTAKADIAEKQTTLLQRHPEYLKEQWAKRVGDYVAKDLPAWQKVSGLWTKNINTVIEDMRKDGINVPDEVAKNISWNDVPTNMDVSGKVLEGMYEHFSDKASSVERLAGGLAGMDQDALDYAVQQGEKTKEVFAAPGSEQRRQPQEIVETNKESLAFMQNVPNPSAGKINPSGAVLAGEVFKGVGSLGAFVFDVARTSKIAGALGASEKLSNAIGMDATVFSGAYEGNYQKAKSLVGDDEQKANLLATTLSAIDVAVFKLPVQKYSAALFSTGKELAAKEFGSVLKNLPKDLKGLSPDVLETTLKKYLSKPISNALIAAGEAGGATVAEAGKLGTLLTAGEILKKVAQSTIAGNDQSDKDWDNLGQEIKDQWSSLPVSLMPGILGLNLLNAGKASAFKKQAAFDAYNNQGRSLADIAKAQEAGIINEQEATKRIQVINTGANILRAMPETNPETGEPISHDGAITWVDNRIREIALQAKREEVKDDHVLSNFYDEKIKGLQAEREQMLRVKPKVDETTVTPASEPNLDLLKDHRDNPAIEGFKTDEEKLKFIAEQSQNVQSDGTVSDLQTPEKAYDAAVNSFDKPLVDAAIKQFPKESLLAPVDKVSVESAIIEINGKTYEGKNHAEAILNAKADGQDISNIDRRKDGLFKLSDGSIIDRATAKDRFGQDRSELLIPQDEAAKKADAEYQKQKASVPLENKKADIKKRKQDELNRLGKLESEISSFKIGDKTVRELFPNGNIKTNGALDSLLETFSKYLSKEQVEKVKQFKNLDIITDKIKAEYDKELADLEKPKQKEVVKGDVTNVSEVLYHGSPNEFDKFENRHGTGEVINGARGHGIYLSHSKEVAEYYAFFVSDKKINIDGKDVLEIKKTDKPWIQHAFIGKTKEETLTELNKQKGRLERGLNRKDADHGDMATDLAEVNMLIDKVEKGKEISIIPTSPNVYKTEVPKNLKWFNWEDKANADLADKFGIDLKKDKHGFDLKEEKTNQDVYIEISKQFGGDKQASEILAKEGFNGIKYKSIEQDKSGKRPEGYNFVIFNPEHITISERNNNPITPEPKLKQPITNVSETKNADLEKLHAENIHAEVVKKTPVLGLLGGESVKEGKEKVAEIKEIKEKVAKIIAKQPHIGQAEAKELYKKHENIRNRFEKLKSLIKCP